MSHRPPMAGGLDRRSLFAVAGGSAVAAAVLAACGGSSAEQIGRVGTGAATPELGDGTVDDGVLLRTSASIERSIAAAYDRILSDGLLDAPSDAVPGAGALVTLLTVLRSHHLEAAATLDTLTTAAGGEPWACGNPRLDEVLIDPIVQRSVAGAPATDAADAIDPSDDVTRDMANLVHALESLSASTCQAMVPLVSIASARPALMQVGVRSSRQAALVALTINPGGYLPGGEEDTATADDGQTPIPLPRALPSQFGALGSITYIGGRGDENGVRQKVSFETPSLNSLVYADLACD